jgi:hypothetical protein
MVASSSLEYVDSIFGISSSSLEYIGCVHKTENNFYSRFQGTSQLENYFMRSDRANNISNLVCTSQLENYFMCSDRLRSMRMDVHGMSYEVCLQLLPLQVFKYLILHNNPTLGSAGISCDRHREIKGLSQDALYKCLNIVTENAAYAR